MKTNLSHRALALLLGMISILLVWTSSVRADILTWWGTGTTANWSDTLNWTNLALLNAAPANGDNLIFANPSPQQIATNDLASLSVGSVTFTSGNFDLFGNLLTLTGGITNTANDNIFDLPLAFSTPQTFEIDASSLTFNYSITNNADLTIAGAGNATWANGFATNVPALGLRGSGNLIVNGPGTVTINGGFIYPSASLNFAGSTIVNGGTLNMNAGDFDGNSQIGQSLTINPGGTVNTSAAHIAGSSGRPLSIYGGHLDMGSEAYFTTITLSNATLSTSNNKDLRGSGTFTNLASAGETIFGVALNLTSSRVIGVGLGSVTSPDVGVDINFSGNATAAITGSGSLTKSGSGKMLISGVDNHTGATIISAGTLALTSTMANTPTITVASNAVFDVSGAGFALSANQTLTGVGAVVGTVNDNVAVAGSAINPGSVGTAGTLTLDQLVLGGYVNLSFDLANTTGIGGGTNDLLVVTNLVYSVGLTNSVNISFLNGTPLVGGSYTLIKYVNAFAGDPSTFLTAAASRYTYVFTNDTAASAIKVVITGTPGPLVWKGDGSTNNWDVNTTSNWLNGVAKDVFLQGDNATFTDAGSNTPPINVAATVQPTVWTVNATKDYTFSGSGKISGGGKLLKSNSGNLTILTPNDNSGGGGLNGTGTVTVGNGGTTVANIGTGTLTNNTKVTFFENASVTYAGNMSGTGTLVSFMPGATLTLTGSNSFSGGLVALNGTTQIGNNTVASVNGNITNYSTLNLYRSDAFTNQNTITSTGNTREYGNGDINVRGALGMTVDGTAPIATGGNLNIGQSAYGKLTVNPGANITVAGTMNIGAPTSINSDVIQNGGTVNVNGYGTVKVLSIGLWGSEVSTYAMNGGTLNLPNAMIDVGSDGIGLLTQTNGTINCTGLSIDNNGVTPAINGTNSTFTMTGGQLNIGVNGISGNAATNALVHTVILSGGTIAAVNPAGWSTAFNLWLTNGSPTIDTTNTAITLSGILGGNGGLTKQGSGYLNMNGTNTYTNVTVVAAGTLQGSGTVVGPITVNSGANISAGATLAAGTLTTSNLTVSSGGNVVIDASSTAASSDLLYVKGALTLAAATPLTLNFLGGIPFTGGVYTVISNIPARTGHLVYSNPTRYTATVNESDASRIQISFSGTNANLVWQGNVNTNWNVTDNNWLNNGVADKYYQSDAVVFDNSGITTSNVNLAAAMTPASVTVDSTGNYTIAGSPIAGVTPLTKSGSGMLTLLNSNAYTGLTTIAAGTLQVGNGGTVGALPAGGTVNDYSSLVFNRSDTATFNGVVNGPGSLTAAGSGTLIITATQNHYGGSTINSGSTVQLGLGPLADSGSLGNGTVTNNGTVIFNRAANVSVAAPYAGNGAFNFLGTGNGGQSGYVLNATNTFTGPVTLSLARIQSGAGAQSFGSPSSITVNPGSQVYAIATAQSPTYNLPLTLNGTGWNDGLGALRIESGATWTGIWAGGITLAANARIGVNNATTNFITGTIGGNYELETYGGNAAARLILAPAATANSYNALRVSIGTAGAVTMAGNANAIPNNIPLTMNGGTLQLNGFSKTFSPFLNLSSSSSIQNGSTSSAANVTLTPMLGSSTYNGTFADGASQPLNVTFTQTPGLWSLALPTLSPNWTGNLTNNGGTISSGTSGTPFGSQAALGRSIVGNNGAVFVTTIKSPFNGYSGNLVLNNSTWVSTRFCSFTANAGGIFLSNSTLTGTNNTDTAYYQLSLPSTVTVRGTAPSYLIGAGNSMGYDLVASASGGTTFDVADATGNAGADLIVGGGSSTAFLRGPANSGTPGTAVTLIKIGAGTMELDGANTYTGPTLINAGTFTLGAAASLASSGIIVSNGATFDVGALPSGLTLNSSETLGGSGTVKGSVTDASGSVIQPGGNGTAGTLTITTNLTLGGAGSLTFDLAGTTGSGNDKIVVGQILTIPSTGGSLPLNFNFLNGAPALGTPYTLIQAGSITGDPTTLTNTQGSRYTMTFAQSGNNLTVTFGGSASNLVWTGTDPLTPATWDLATSTNWFDGSGPNMFYQLDTVRFDDTSVNTNVTLNVSVSPATVTVDSTNNYAITGTGGIAGNSRLIKNNTNTLTLSAASTFTGNTTVNAGILKLGGTSPLGARVNTVNVTNGAQLDFNADAMGSDNTRGYGFTVGGSGPDGSGALINSGGAIFSFANVSNLTLTADTVVGGNNGRWDIGGMPAGNTIISGNNHSLTKVGSFQMDFRPQYITNLTSLSILNGTVYSDGYSFTNSATTNTTIYVLNTNNTTLGINSGLAWNMPMVVSNTTLYNNSGSGSISWLGNVTVLGTNLFNNAGSQFFAGVVSGPGAINVNGGVAALTLSNANTYAGGIIISNAPVTTSAADATAGSAAVVAGNPGAFGTGPVVISGLGYPALTTNASWFATNVLRAVEFAFSAPGTVTNSIVLPATVITNVSLHGHDGGQAVNLTGVISGGFSGMTNWIDFGDAATVGVMRYGNSANTFLGNISAFRGALAITADGSLGNAANILRLNSAGGLRFDAPGINVAHNISVTTSATTLNVYGDNDGNGFQETANDATISGIVSTVASSGLALNLVGGTNIAGTSYGSLTLSGPNTFDAQLTVGNNTKLIAASAGSLGLSSYFVIVANGGTLSLNLNGTYNSRALQLSGAGVQTGGVGIGALENMSGTNTRASSITLNAPSTIGVTAGSLNLSGAISGAFPLTKIGPGSLTLGATETYTLGTFVNAGTLFLNGSLPVGNAVSVGSGATLAGVGTINSAVTVQAGATLAPGTNAVGKLTVNGPLNLFGSTVMEVSKTAATNDLLTGMSTVFYGGALVVTNLGGSYLLGDTLTLFQAGSYSGGFTNVTLPALTGGLAWTNKLVVNGTIQVVVAPPTASSVGYLTNLVLSNNLNAVVGLTPGFTTNLPSGPYAATNTLPANQVNVTVTDADPTATNTLFLNGGSPVLLSSGIPSSLLSLNAGSNNVTVQVVSQDLSVTNNYTVNVMNQPSQVPPKLTNSVSGGLLNLSWGSEYQGYRLQVQTNNLNKGVSKLTGDWDTVVGSSTITATNLPIIKVGVTNEYYRLIYP